jgi:hypothetical protein
MGMTRFAANDVLWREILACVAKPGKKLVAVAYVGTKGASLLPLQRGDRLVVDMSLDTVRRGATDPREIDKLRKRGVLVFTRRRLHAKFIIAGKTMIASSANVSSNSRDRLDEVGIITTEPVAVARAKDFFDRLCTTLVRPRYLRRCIEEYNPPPKGKTAETVEKGSERQGRVVEATLWFLGGITNLDHLGADQRAIEKVETRAEKKLKHPEKTCVTWVRYPRRPKFMDHIRDGDWVVECSRDGKQRYVTPPAQVLDQDSYTSPKGWRYEMLMLEAPDVDEKLPLSKFRQRVKRIEPALDRESPRTRAIENDEHADQILRLWTPAGRVAKLRR